MKNIEEENYPIWHPYSKVNKKYSNMLNIVKGYGIYLFDSSGKKYIDASSGNWNVSLGYSNTVDQLFVH